MEYENLYDVIPESVWEKFSYASYYIHEDTILKPELERQGFTNVRFFMGESDSFGPLSRIIKCVDKDGHHRQFIYG